jgi:hypothetical protein
LPSSKKSDARGFPWCGLIGWTLLCGSRADPCSLPSCRPLGYTGAQDLAAFSSASFNLADWLNAALAAAPPAQMEVRFVAVSCVALGAFAPLTQHPTQAHASKLITKLQIVIQARFNSWLHALLPHTAT